MDDEQDRDVEYRERLHQRLVACAQQRAQLDCSEGELLVEMKRLRLWRQFGCASALEYMERVLGYAPHAALERLRVAHELEQLPQMKTSLREGSLCFSAVRELTRVVEPATEGAWISAARDKNVRQIEELVAHHTKGDLPSDSPDPTPKVCKLRFEGLKPETLALIREARKALDTQLGTGRMDDDTFLQTLCRQALEPVATKEAVELVTPPAYKMSIVTCKRCARSWQNGAGLDLLVDPEVVDRGACDAKLLGDLDAAVPERVTQSVTPRKREQVFVRDGFRCVVPGCRAGRGLDIHHIEPQEEGGSHDLWNLCLLCSGHHTQLHEGTLTLSGRAPHGLTFGWTRRGWWKSHVGRSVARVEMPMPETQQRDEVDGDGTGVGTTARSAR